MMLSTINKTLSEINYGVGYTSKPVSFVTKDVAKHFDIGATSDEDIIASYNRKIKGNLSGHIGGYYNINRSDSGVFVGISTRF